MSVDLHAHKIAILDFGSQYTQLIARRIREIGVFCEIFSYDISAKDLKMMAPHGIIFSGGPESVHVDSPIAPDKAIYDLGLPILGICYGMQVMQHQLGGKVDASSEREFGHAQVRLHGHSPLFEAIEDYVDSDGRALIDVWMSHGDKVVSLADGFECLAETKHAPYAAVGDQQKHFYGVQFHPEVTHTPQGNRMLEHFVVQVCGCECLWTADKIIEDQLAQVREIVGDDEVVLGLSGGVDSSVVAALLHQAIGEQLTCVFVDNGLLRLNEGDQVMQLFAKHLGMHVIRADAEQQFLSALKGVSDPEAKRKVIGHAFIDVFDVEASKLKNAKWLAQGTIYPDVIESAASKHGKAHLIKSHHNVGGLPDDMKLNVLEPLRELFKDEVRRIGESLGLPHDLLYRHPFPGPGLGVRVLGEIVPSYLEPLRLADHIFIEELHAQGWYDKVSQAFAVFLPVKSVGVVGDQRQYEPVIALRAVETIDFMTARWAELPHAFLGHVSNRIMNEVPGISRVVYDISGKPPATIEWE